MTESQEISARCSFITDSMRLGYLTQADGELFAAISTEIVTPVDGLASMLELINAKHVTLRATPSA